MPRFPNSEKVTLSTSLDRYESHLRKLLDDPTTKSQFLELRKARHIGCFCEPQQRCHVDTILCVLRELVGDDSAPLPQRQCLKVKYLRPRWRDLKEYNARPLENVAAVRSGRVFRVGHCGKKKRYVYPASPWCNPYRVKAS